MYFVDRELIEDKLQYLEKVTVLFQSKQNWENAYDKIALERMVQLMMDAVLDVGNAMIDGFIMRDPGSYEDIIDILVDEKVIETELEKHFKALLPIRKDLVQAYTKIDHDKILHILKDHFEGFTQYPDRIRAYLKNELDTVTAFKPTNS